MLKRVCRVSGKLIVLSMLVITMGAGGCTGSGLRIGTTAGTTSSTAGATVDVTSTTGGTTGTIGNTGGGSTTSTTVGGGSTIALIGDDGMCGGQPCPQGQQCCFSTGRCVAPSNVTSDCPTPKPVPAVCGGVTCPSGQICCLVGGNCIDPSTAGTSCPKPSATSSGTDAGLGSTSLSCASNADCLPTQFCTQPPGSLLCLGPGICQSRSNCGFSSGTTTKFCGCDGVNYPSVQAACVVGVSLMIGSPTPCGTTVNPTPTPGSPRVAVTYCGGSDQCPTGQQCCSITGRCYDPSVPYLCTLPPPGTTISCVDDSQCTTVEFCSGSGCSGPGGCLGFGSGDCGGELSPVCGCDGNSYTNAGCAVAVGVRIAHDGVCEGADAGP
jgi:hypothetical protein